MCDRFFVHANGDEVIDLIIGFTVAVGGVVIGASIGYFVCKILDRL